MNPDTFFDNFDMLADVPDGVQKLRELILQLAVQGKLVAQDENDEPATALLEKIRLIRKNKIIKSKSTLPIKVSDMPFEIPNGWQWVRLGDIQNFVNGYAFKSQQYKQSGIGIIRIGDIQMGGITKNSMKFVDSDYFNILDEKLKVKPGDLVLAMSGATTGKLGFNKTNETFLLNQRVGKLEFTCVDSIYAYLYLTTKIQENLRISSGSAIPNLSTTQINNIEFPLPPLTEQRRIVAKVDQLMVLCDELEARQKKKHTARTRLNSAALSKLTSAPDGFMKNWQNICDNFELLYDAPETVGELKKAILQLAVMGKLVAQDENDETASVLLERIREEKERLIKEGEIKKVKALPAINFGDVPFDLPDGWKWVRIDDIYEVVGGIQKTPKRTPESNFFPYLRVGNVYRGKLKLYDIEYFELFEDELDKWRLQAGDLLVVEGNGSEKEVGRCAI